MAGLWYPILGEIHSSTYDDNNHITVQN